MTYPMMVSLLIYIPTVFVTTTVLMAQNTTFKRISPVFRFIPRLIMALLWPLMLVNIVSIILIDIILNPNDDTDDIDEYKGTLVRSVNNE